MRCRRDPRQESADGRATTITDPHAAAQPDLIRRDLIVDAAQLDTRWCGDSTYIDTAGRTYLAAVFDLASRRVAGWAVADTIKTDLVDAAQDTAGQSDVVQLGSRVHPMHEREFPGSGQGVSGSGCLGI